MRTISYQVAITLDGFLADLAHDVAFFAFEGGHVEDYLRALREHDTIVMGRKTFEYGVRLGVRDPYPWADTYVCSRTLRAEPNDRVTLTEEDPRALLRRLRATEGSPILLVGGGELAHVALEAGLLDEVVVKVNPVLLGSGVPMVSRLGAPQRLRLRATKVHDGGVVVHHYEVVRAAA